MYIPRLAEAYLDNWLDGPKSLLFLGPRQTGKTTLVEKWMAETKGFEIHSYKLQDPPTRRRFESDPGILKRELRVTETIKKLIFIDEVQKVPELMDAIQLLIDEYKGGMKFILTGSSVRKLRKSGANVLPGRLLQKRLDPIMWYELQWARDGQFNIFPEPPAGTHVDIDYTMKEALIWGALPEIILTGREARSELLTSYVNLYLEQEIRAEALTKNLGAFDRFLELAALESGTAPNLTRLSNASGVAISTIKEYYNILTETFVVERLDPFIFHPRKRLFTTPRYYFFDTGVRNACGKIPMEEGILRLEGGRLFEHFVVLEVIRRIRFLNLPWKTYFWRTAGGAEVDLIIDKGMGLVPIEIKFSQNVSMAELKGLANFISEHKDRVENAYVVSTVERPQRLAENIVVIPWQAL